MTELKKDMIVRHKENGKHYRIRSVSRTKAVCVSCKKDGSPPGVGFRTVAIEYDIKKLEIIS
jgi:hypothetical protein